MEELKKKIAEWLGFIRNKQNLGRGSEHLWLRPDSKIGTLPDFPNDLNACFEYIVPKLIRCEIWRNLTYKDGGIVGGDWSALVSTGDHSTSHPLETGVDETPALALCRAVEKLIQGEEDANSG